MATTEKSLNTAVLLLGFIRFQTAQKVFDEIRKAKPKKFFLAVDGPRTDRPDDERLCQATRDIAKQVDWDCEVKTLFQEKNLGCGLGTATAINWFFDNVDEGIIFDDDCVPDQSFFYFCQDLLRHYRNNPKIMHISGDNFQNGKKRGNGSYYFSKYTHNWGWATWKRAWQHFDFTISGPETMKHTWDKQWLKSVEKQNGLAILPNINLISNIGFGGDASHTKEIKPYSNLIARSILFPLKHPASIKRNVMADIFTYKNHFQGSMTSLLYRTIKSLIPIPIKSAVKFPYKKLKERSVMKRHEYLFKKYSRFTMIPKSLFLKNLKLIERFSGIKGAVVECGVWRGGMIAAMSEILGNKRCYYLFDSFEGLPKANAIDGEAAINWQKDTKSPLYFDNCSAEAKYAEDAMNLSGVKKYKVIKGWFKDTLPTFEPDEKIAILRLDSDWYESTTQCLDNLYKDVVEGGLIIIDDYYTWDGCTKAVHDFLSKNGLSSRIYGTEKGICYIIKK